MKKNETDGIHYFNRCRRCSSLITKLDVLKAFNGDGVLCGCGGSMFSPSNLHWYEYLYPKVWLVYWAHFRGNLKPAPAPSRERTKPPRVEVVDEVKPSVGFNDQTDNLEDFDSLVD